MSILKNWDYMNLNSESIKIKNTIIGEIRTDLILFNFNPFEVNSICTYLSEIILQGYGDNNGNFIDN